MIIWKWLKRLLNINLKSYLDPSANLICKLVTGFDSSTLIDFWASPMVFCEDSDAGRLVTVGATLK